MLISVLAYAGLRRGDALALRWGDVRERTILGVMRRDLAAWKPASGRPADSALVFPAANGQL